MDLIDININYCVWKEKFTDILIIQNLDSEITNLVMQTKTMLRKAMHVNRKFHQLLIHVFMIYRKLWNNTKVCIICFDTDVLSSD